jgi:hypothetical protein
MVDRQFFDTDILVCAFAADDPRNARAEVLIAPYPGLMNCHVPARNGA